MEPDILKDAEQAPRGLLRAIEAGELRMEPGEAERRAAAWRHYRDRIEELANRAEALARSDGFGDCNIGHLLGTAFAQKADGGPDSTRDALLRLRDIADNMAAAHEAAGRAYQQREEENAEAFRRIG